MQGEPYINLVAVRPSARPWCPALRSPLVPRLMANEPCGSRAGFRAALRGKEESRPTLALAFILGHVVSLTAPLLFACGSSSLVHRHRVVSGVTSGDSRPISGDISGPVDHHSGTGTRGATCMCVDSSGGGPTFRVDRTLVHRHVAVIGAIGGDSGPDSGDTSGRGHTSGG